MVRELSGSASAVVLARDEHEAEDNVDWSLVTEDIEVITLQVYAGDVEDDPALEEPLVTIDY